MSVRAWVTPELVLYLHDGKLAPEDTEAPDRPSRLHEWEVGVGWVVPDDVAERAATREVDGLSRFLFELNLNQENRLRRLEGKTELTRGQYRSLLIVLAKLVASQ